MIGNRLAAARAVEVSVGVVATAAAAVAVCRNVRRLNVILVSSGRYLLGGVITPSW